MSAVNTTMSTVADTWHQFKASSSRGDSQASSRQGSINLFTSSPSPSPSPPPPPTESNDRGDSRGVERVRDRERGRGRDRERGDDKSGEVRKRVGGRLRVEKGKEMENIEYEKVMQVEGRIPGRERERGGYRNRDGGRRSSGYITIERDDVRKDKKEKERDGVREREREREKGERQRQRLRVSEIYNGLAMSSVRSSAASIGDKGNCSSKNSNSNESGKGRGSNNDCSSDYNTAIDNSRSNESSDIKDDKNSNKNSGDRGENNSNYGNDNSEDDEDKGGRDYKKSDSDGHGDKQNDDSDNKRSVSNNRKSRTRKADEISFGMRDRERDSKGNGKTHSGVISKRQHSVSSTTPTVTEDTWTNRPDAPATLGRMPVMHGHTFSPSAPSSVTSMIAHTAGAPGTHRPRLPQGFGDDWSDASSDFYSIGAETEGDAAYGSHGIHGNGSLRGNFMGVFNGSESENSSEFTFGRDTGNISGYNDFNEDEEGSEISPHHPQVILISSLSSPTALSCSVLFCSLLFYLI